MTIHRGLGDLVTKLMERVCEIRRSVPIQDSDDPLLENSLLYVSAAAAANHRDRTNRASSPCRLTWSNQPITSHFCLIQQVVDQSNSLVLRNDSTLTRLESRKKEEKPVFEGKWRAPPWCPFQRTMQGNYRGC